MSLCKVLLKTADSSMTENQKKYPLTKARKQSVLCWQIKTAEKAIFETFFKDLEFWHVYNFNGTWFDLETQAIF